jgi:Gpi18-like mannosyltransferase
MGKARPWQLIGLALALLAALALRLALFSQTNGDLRFFLIPWYDYIRSHGGWRALADNFSNYSPPYTYFLVLLTYLPFIPRVIGIKLVSIIFDFVLAYAIGRIIYLKYGARAGWAAALLALFTPSIFLVSAAWGQCDGMYVACLGLSLLTWLEGRPAWGLAWISTAFAFKAQAGFLGVLALVLLVLRFHWKHLLIPPLVYLAWMLPALAAGRSLLSVLLVYPNQAETYRQLSMNAPSLYVFFSDRLYDTLLPLGLGLAALLSLALAGLSIYRRRRLDYGGLILLAALSVLLLPYFLPKMHERYFYAAAAFALLLPFVNRRLWPVALVLQVTTACSYAPFLYRSEVLPFPLLAALNGAALAVLLGFYLRHLMLPPKAEPSP